MRLPELWSSAFSGNHAVRNHCTEKVRLDNAFVLIEGHPKFKIIRSPGHPAQNDAAPANVSTLADSLEKARSAVTLSEGQTERQYADGVVHDIKFPGRDDWEHRLYAQQLKVIAASHAVLDAVAANASGAVIRVAKYDFDLEVIARDHLKAEGIGKAAAWERNR